MLCSPIPAVSTSRSALNAVQPDPGSFHKPECTQCCAARSRQFPQAGVHSMLCSPIPAVSTSRSGLNAVQPDPGSFHKPECTVSTSRSQCCAARSRQFPQAGVHSMLCSPIPTVSTSRSALNAVQPDPGSFHKPECTQCCAARSRQFPQAGVHSMLCSPIPAVSTSRSALNAVLLACASQGAKLENGENTKEKY